MTLHRYFARRFLLAFLALVVVFILLQTLIDLIDELGDFPDQSFSAVLGLVILDLPESLYELMPLILILAAVAVFLNLARHSELVVMRASGRSGLFGLRGPALVTLLIGIALVTLINPLVATSYKWHHSTLNLYRGSDPDVLALNRDGLWLREGQTSGDDDVTTGQVVIHAIRVDPQQDTLIGVSFLLYGADGLPHTRIEAASAVLRDRQWHLKTVKLWPLSGTRNPEAAAQRLSQYTLPATINRDNLTSALGNPLSTPLWSLPGHIRKLQRAGFAAQSHRMWFHSELAKPVFLVALVVLAAAFCMRHARITHAGLSALKAVLLGFALYYVRNFAIILGENGQIPVIVAAWLPAAASLMLAIGLVLHLEDG